MNRSSRVLLCFGAFLCISFVSVVNAQPYPSKVVRVIVPYAAGGVLYNEKFREQILAPQFYEPVGNTPEEFAEFLKGQRLLAADLVKTVGLKPFD